MKANKNSTYRYSNQLKSSQINSNQSNTLDSRSWVFLKLLIYASWYCDQILLNRQPHLHYSAHTYDQSRVYDQRPQMFDCRWFFLFYTDPICNSKVRWKSFLFQAKWSSVFFLGGDRFSLLKTANDRFWILVINQHSSDAKTGYLGHPTQPRPSAISKYKTPWAPAAVDEASDSWSHW